MLVIPAIDLKGGKCVRLLRGDLHAETVYGDDPVAMGRRWVDAGARYLHVVDLDGAVSGAPVNGDAIAALCAKLPIPVEVGGGVRTIERAGAVLLLAHDLLDLLEHAKAERQPSVDAGGLLADEARAQHEPVRDDLRFLRSLAQNGQEVAGKAHERIGRIVSFVSAE